MKKCAKCLVPKMPDAYYKSTRGRDGLQSWCKGCSTVWVKNNPTKVKAYGAAWARANREVVRANVAAWAEKNPEKRAASAARFRAANPEKLKAYRAAYCAANPEKLKALTAARYKAGPKKMNEASRAWYAANSERARAERKVYRGANIELIKIRESAYQRANPAKMNAKNAKRRARKMHATPVWANEFYISEIYDLAARRTKLFGFSWHVDHAVPLQGRNVCGLHVHNNLQVITGVENMRKHNLFSVGG